MKVGRAGQQLAGKLRHAIQRTLTLTGKLLENHVLELLPIGLAMIGRFQLDGSLGVGKRFPQPAGCGVVFGSFGRLAGGLGVRLNRGQPMGRLLPIGGFLSGSCPGQ